ncbi:hypothetical protein BKA56DRAFT_35632 [Ilyonectria sp. MPI-CAGE-AT-0026]|nr:hypothetical protein BKA56DRAFT_35632 [Ilyonectria sp. MPI-CAGE-AT-0026]
MEREVGWTRGRHLWEFGIVRPREDKASMAWHQALPSGALCPAICIRTITGWVVGGVKRGGTSRISDIAGGAKAMQLDGIGMAIGIDQGSPVDPKPNKRCLFPRNEAARAVMVAPPLYRSALKLRTRLGKSWTAAISRAWPRLSGTGSLCHGLGFWDGRSSSINSFILVLDSWRVLTAGTAYRDQLVRVHTGAETHTYPVKLGEWASGRAVPVSVA